MKYNDKNNLLAFLYQNNISTLSSTDCNIGKLSPSRFNPISRIIQTTSVIIKPIHTNKVAHDQSDSNICNRNHYLFDHPYISLIWDTKLGIPAFSSMILSPVIQKLNKTI